MHVRGGVELSRPVCLSVCLRVWVLGAKGKLVDEGLLIDRLLPSVCQPHSGKHVTLAHGENVSSQYEEAHV